MKALVFIATLVVSFAVAGVTAEAADWESPYANGWAYAGANPPHAYGTWNSVPRRGNYMYITTDGGCLPGDAYFQVDYVYYTGQVVRMSRSGYGHCGGWFTPLDSGSLPVQAYCQIKAGHQFFPYLVCQSLIAGDDGCGGFGNYCAQKDRDSQGEQLSQAVVSQELELSRPIFCKGFPTVALREHRGWYCRKCGTMVWSVPKPSPPREALVDAQVLPSFDGFRYTLRSQVDGTVLYDSPYGFRGRRKAEEEIKRRWPNARVSFEVH